MISMISHGLFSLKVCKTNPTMVPARSITTPIPTAEFPPRTRKSSKQSTVWLQQTGLFLLRVDTIIPKAPRMNQHPILKDNSAPPFPKNRMIWDHRGRRIAPPRNSSTPTIWDKSWRKKPAAFKAPTPVMKIQSHQCKYACLFAQHGGHGGSSGNNNSDIFGSKQRPVLRKKLPRGPLLLFEPSRFFVKIKVARDNGLSTQPLYTDKTPGFRHLCWILLCPHTLPLGVYRVTPLAHED